MKYSYFILTINLFILPFQTFSQWKKCDTAPNYKGKQDDIFFIDENLGWYVNGSGQIFKTYNGGELWSEVFKQPGTFFRCIGFVDSLNGYVGNIGTDYFPGVTDTIPLYQTKDGGKSWQPVNYNGPYIKGICAIDILKIPFINSGVLDYKIQIVAAGRVGAPAGMIKSIDGGQSFKSMEMNDNCAFILDVKFFNANEGIICAASSDDLEKTNALILMTKDGGLSWQNKYQSKRNFELTWKCSFPSRMVGYVTIQSYNPDSLVNARYIAKTNDGGETWNEILLNNDFACREFGVGFVTDNYGWVGGMSKSYETINGGKNWREISLGKAVNKFRIIKNNKKYISYSIGTEVFKNTGLIPE
jgi:photosystem II stability/assembly factor-like uncharacterized protein